MIKHPVSRTKNNILVYVDLIQSPAAKRISQQPQLMTYAKEALKGQVLKNAQNVKIEFDMGRQIGTRSIVPTTSDDSVFYARLIKDKLYTRFVKIAKPQPTQLITLCLEYCEDNSYQLHDLWIGNTHPPRPGSEDETNDSKDYWSRHAFTFTHQPLQASTITKTQPY